VASQADPSENPYAPDRFCRVWKHGHRLNVMETRPLSKLACDQIVFGPDFFLAVNSFEAPHRKMFTGDGLKMIEVYEIVKFFE
jgi:hypothetical protein